MTIAAANVLSDVQENARSLLAASTAWQTWTGAADATQAAEHVYYKGLPRPPLPPEEESEPEAFGLKYQQGLRPFAILDFPPESAFAWSLLSPHGTGGQLDLLFVDNIAPGDEYDVLDAERDFVNKLGDVLEDLATNSGVNLTAYLRVTEIRLAEGPWRGGEDERATRGDYVAARVELQWSQVGG